MAQAYVLINLEPRYNVIDKVRNLPSVAEAYRVHGVYDLIVKVVAEDLRELRKTIIDQIRRIDGVRSTMTLIVTD